MEIIGHSNTGQLSFQRKRGYKHYKGLCPKLPLDSFTEWPHFSAGLGIIQTPALTCGHTGADKNSVKHREFHRKLLSTIKIDDKFSKLSPASPADPLRFNGVQVVLRPTKVWTGLVNRTLNTN